MKHLISVCGDLVWDTHIARLKFDPKGYFQAHSQTQLVNRYGAAWYLRFVIEQALRSAGFEDVEVVAPPQTRHEAIEESRKNSGGIAKAFSVWEWFEGTPKPATAKRGTGDEVEFSWRDGRPEPGAWRIREFLGCQQARWEDSQGNALTCPALPATAQPPDLLVIDDLGLGFASHEPCWPACLSSPENRPAHILLKGTASFDTPLWQKLLAPEFSQVLTVILSAAALRDRGAQLSRGLSWDQTVREIKEVFEPGGFGSILRHCHRVVVIFDRSGAAVFSRVPRSPAPAESHRDTLQFERFVFDPGHLEETWSRDRNGVTFGASSMMTAAFAVHQLMDPRPSSHVTVSRGLAAARQLHLAGGGGNEKDFQLEACERFIFDLAAEQKPENVFRSAFPRELLDPPELVSDARLPPLAEQTLLTDALGVTASFLTVAAQDIVRWGKNRPLRSVPHLSCGKYYTVDREEIERLNAVRNLILDYQSNRNDTRPLSLAVFGPPGAGKSFAIKQLSEVLFGKEHAALEFNLSQCTCVEDLHEAFHEVRDKSVQGKMPFVFWDEFDAPRDNVALGWLKEFLAPMQDAKFIANGREHPFGKCIFVFAGGTKDNYSKFDRSQATDNDDFRSVKGPDFVSRLRGYVNIKGPNPTTPDGDHVHVVRRALLLRSLIERHYPGIIHPGTNELAISPAVLNAFLAVKCYYHGARSIESLVSLSRLQRCRRFGPSELPSPEAVNLHVSPDFAEIVGDTSRHHLTSDDIEALAKTMHDHWRAGKQGYVYGSQRNDQTDPKTHPMMREFELLTEDQKEANRLPARLTALRLESLGYRIVAADQVSPESLLSLDEALLKKLARSEHRRWMREKLLCGAAYALDSNEGLFLHRDLRRFESLPADESSLDRQIVEAIMAFLREKNLWLVKNDPSTGPVGRPS